MQCACVCVCVCDCVFLCVYVCVCVVYDVQRRLVLRGCLRKYLQQLIAKSAAMPTHQLPAPMQQPPTTISSSRLMPFGIAAAQGVGHHLATRKSKCTLHFRFVHISASVAACSRRAHLPNGACICDTCKQQLQRLKRGAWQGGVVRNERRKKLENCIAGFGTSKAPTSSATS